MNPLDRLVAWFSPVVGVRREHARRVLRAYAAAEASPQHPRPLRANRSPDGDVYAATPVLRERARHLDANHDLTVGILSELVTQTVGAGVLVLPMPMTRAGTPLPDLAAELYRLWDEWAASAVDTTGQLDLCSAEHIAARAWFRDGEHFSRDVIGRDRGYAFRADEVPYRVELAESEVCPADLFDDRRGIEYGITLNQWRAPRAYHFLKQHPGETTHAHRRRVSFDDTVAVPAELVRHLAFRRRHPQTRGVSALHAIVRRLEDVGHYEESERIAARVAAAMVGFIQRAPDLEYPVPTDAQTGEVALPETGERSTVMSAGMLYDNLLPGETVGTISHDRPNTALVDYRLAMLKAAAAGSGTRFSSIARHYEASYSAMRQQYVDSAALYLPLWRQFVGMIARHWYRTFATVAVLDGRLRLPASTSLSFALAADYLPPVQPYVQPLQEVQADQVAVDAGFTSRIAVQRKRNPNPLQVAEQIRQEQAAARPAVDNAQRSGSSITPLESYR